MWTLSRVGFYWIPARSVIIVSPEALEQRYLLAPLISSGRGTFADGETFTIDGGDFGTKQMAPPLLFADFDAGINPTSGTQRQWDEVVSMGYAAGEGVNGTGAAKATDGNGKWALGLLHDYWTSE